MTAAANSVQANNSADQNPPRPKLTLRVGITGHRPKVKTFPSEMTEHVQRVLGETFTAINTVLEELKPENKDFYAKCGDTIPHKVRLVSGLAEGADQMAVAAIPEQWELDAILPLPESDYLLDFKSSARDGSDVTAAFVAARKRATTLIQVPRDPQMAHAAPTDPAEREKYRQMRTQAYVRSAHFLVGQIDLLVAVWNGEREEGPGGTAEVVRGALNAGIPIVWISSLKPVAPRMILDTDDDAQPIAPDANALQGPLKRAISTIIAPPAAAPTPGHGARNPDAATRLKQFFDEAWPRRSFSLTYDLFYRFMRKSKLRWIIRFPTMKDAQQDLEPFIGDTPEETDKLRERLRAVLCPRYVWADVLAVERSHWYRSAYINCFLMAALLVAIALGGVFVHDIYGEESAGMLRFKAVLVAIELGLILFVVWIVRRGRRSRWQEKWVEYRALAEMLRSVLFLSYIGEHGYVQRGQDLEPASSAWFLWYLRATIRELGLPGALLDGTYQNKLLLAVQKHVVDGQVGYNTTAAATLSRMYRLLHIVGDSCFLLTGIVLGLFLIGYVSYLAGGLSAGYPFAELAGWRGNHTLSLDTVDLCGNSPWFMKLGRVLFSSKSIVTFLAALLPALGAAVFGIRETGDFEGFARRAARTAEKLAQIKIDIAKASRKLVLTSTTATLLETAQVMSEDVGAWQSVYGRKQLSLPA